MIGYCDVAGADGFQAAFSRLRSVWTGRERGEDSRERERDSRGGETERAEGQCGGSSFSTGGDWLRHLSGTERRGRETRDEGGAAA